MTRRCPWAQAEPSVYYHDTEWGVPLHHDRALFELLTLEGAPGGPELDDHSDQARKLSPCVPSLRRRRGRPLRGPGKRPRFSLNPGIVRNRLKIAAAIQQYVTERTPGTLRIARRRGPRGGGAGRRVAAELGEAGEIAQANQSGRAGRSRNCAGGSVLSVIKASASPALLRATGTRCRRLSVP
jgi:hypothetical protein